MVEIKLTGGVPGIQEYILDNPDLFSSEDEVCISFTRKLPVWGQGRKEITYFEMNIKDFMRS